MSALTSIFNFLYVYLRAIFCFVTGTLFDIRYFPVAEQKEIARQIIIIGSNGQLQEGLQFFPRPILLLIFGIFVVGAFIGLTRRLMR